MTQVAFWNAKHYVLVGRLGLYFGSFMRLKMVERIFLLKQWLVVGNYHSTLLLSTDKWTGDRNT